MPNTNGCVVYVKCEGCGITVLKHGPDAACLPEIGNTLHILLGRMGWTRDRGRLWCPLCVRQRRPEAPGASPAARLPPLPNGP